MCHRCTQGWIPMNHPKSKGLTFFGERFRDERLHSIRQPFAELRRRMSMKGRDRLGTRYADSLRQTREWIEKWRPA